MPLSRCSSEPSLHSSSGDDMAFQGKPTRCNSGFMEITLPTGDVIWESSTSVQSDDLFGSGHVSDRVSQGKDEEIPGYGTHKTKSREHAPKFMDSSAVISALSNLDIDMFNSFFQNVRDSRNTTIATPFDHALMKTPHGVIEHPSGVRTTPITQNAVPEDVILPADKVKSAIPELVNKEWDVMSVSDQLIATGHMTLHTYRVCHEMSKPKQGADYGRGLRREFLLYLAENPISWRALSAAMDKAGLTDIKQYLCPINQ